MSFNRNKRAVYSSFKSIMKKMRDQDLFGHQVSLNFNKRGPRHKTYIGGFFSLFVKGIIYFYVILTLKEMIL